MNENKNSNLEAIIWTALAVTLGILFISNPKPAQVYEVLHEEAIKNIHQQMSQNALMGLLGSALAEQVTPDRMRAFFVVHHVDAMFASIFLVEPTELGKVTLQLANKPTDAVLLCGLGNEVFQCPSFIASKFSNLTPDIRAESIASTETAITVGKPNSADRFNKAVQADTNRNHSAPLSNGGATVTADLKKLVAAWNEAHSTRDSAAFSYLYDDTILFYRTQKVKSSSIAEKALLFKKYPTFNQQIIGDINVEQTPDGEVQCRFVKRVSVNGVSTDYPSYLVFREVSDGWKIVVEGDSVTDSNLTRRSTKQRFVPGGAVAGDFNGDGKLEYMWVQAPKVDEKNEFGSCVGECNSQIHFSDSSIPSIEVVNSIGGDLSSLGDLNANGADEVGIKPHWFTSCWSTYYVWTLKDGRWKSAVDGISTHCNQWDSAVKPIEIDPENDGHVIIRYSEFADGEILTKQNSVKINR